MYLTFVSRLIVPSRIFKRIVPILFVDMHYCYPYAQHLRQALQNLKTNHCSNTYHTNIENQVSILSKYVSDNIIENAASSSSLGFFRTLATDLSLFGQSFFQSPF